MENLEEGLRHWHNLTEEEKGAIRDPRDYPLLSVIDGLSSQERRSIYRAIRFKDIGDYKREELPWLRDFIHYLVENRKKKDLDCSPETINKIFFDEMEKDGIHERFRLYYAAKFRDRIEKPTGKEVTDFLSEVDAVLMNLSSN